MIDCFDMNRYRSLSNPPAEKMMWGVGGGPGQRVSQPNSDYQLVANYYAKQGIDVYMADLRGYITITHSHNYNYNN